jgi:hypothetical protein
MKSDGYDLMTLSARASTFGGIVRPICLAVIRLFTSSNLVGCSTGRSPGLAPFKILIDEDGGATITLGQIFTV